MAAAVDAAAAALEAAAVARRYEGDTGDDTRNAGALTTTGGVALGDGHTALTPNECATLGFAGVGDIEREE